MARRRRSDMFVPEEIAVVHVMNRVARGSYLFGKDLVSGKDYSYRQRWLEERLHCRWRVSELTCWDSRFLAITFTRF